MINICISIQIGVGSYVLGICGYEDYLLTGIYVCRNYERSKQKLNRKLYYPSQVQEATHLKQTKLSFF